MVGHLRRFITSPLPLFEFGFPSESRAPPPLSAAAKCLALCIRVRRSTQSKESYLDWLLLQLSPGDDLVMSNMYSLLNYIAATSKEIYDSNSTNINFPLPHGQGNPHSLENGLRSLSEDERRLVGISKIGRAHV